MLNTSKRAQLLYACHEPYTDKPTNSCAHPHASQPVGVRSGAEEPLVSYQPPQRAYGPH